MDNDSSQRSIFTARISWRRLGCLGCKPAVWRWATLWRKITSRGVQLIPGPANSALDTQNPDSAGPPARTPKAWFKRSNIREQAELRRRMVTEVTVRELAVPNSLAG
jgi:hypothetical protein